MSAWPEAVYIIREIQNSFNLNTRVLKLQNRLVVFAPIDEDGQTFGPDLEEEYNFSNDSIWFIEKANNDDEIYAVSVYSEVEGWSEQIYLSPEAGKVSFASTTGGTLSEATNVEEALNILEEALNNVSVNDATTSSKGIVQIGSNINVEDGVISIPTASSISPGIMKMFTSTGTSTEGTMTQKAITDAIGQNPSQSENVLVSNWNSEEKVSLSGSNELYYATPQIVLSNSYGAHPTISLVETSPNQVPTAAQKESFNQVDFVLVDGNRLTFYASKLPTTDFTVNVKM